MPVCKCSSCVRNTRIIFLQKKITFTFKVQCTDDEPDSIPRIPVSFWQQSGFCVRTVAPQEGHSVAQSWPWPHEKPAGQSPLTM